MSFQLAAFADEAGADLSTQINAMKKHGISYLEIRGVGDKNISQITSEEAKKIKAELDNASLAVWSLGSPYGKIGINDDFGRHFDSFCRGLELANILDCNRIRVFSFYTPSGENPDSFRDTVMERLEKMVTAAKNSGIMLCHENEKGIYGDIAARCVDIHRTFPEIKAVFDPANFIQCGEDTKAAWEMLADYVEYMHIKDALADGTVVPAGKGIGNIPLLLSKYKGNVLTLEPHLTVFKGLAELEQSDEKTNIPTYKYATAEQAFAAAVNALKELI